MEYEKPYQQEVINAVKKNTGHTGWAFLANVGKAIKDQDIKYDKLLNFINNYTDILDLKCDDSQFPPVHYVKIKNHYDNSSQPSSFNLKQHVAGHFTEDKPYSYVLKNAMPKNALKEWAWLSKEDKPYEELESADYKKWMGMIFQKTIADLKNLALNERWCFHTQHELNPYPILINYLTYTFYRLLQEKNKIQYSDNYASFNTGLVDKRYEPIYALFQKNKNLRQPWRLIDFCIAGEEYAGKTLVKQFAYLPKRAQYFKDISEMVYDTFAGPPKIDIKHILFESIQRLPLQFLKEYAPKSFDFTEIDNISYSERTPIYDNLRIAIENDSKCERNFVNRIKDALDLSLKRVEWNFKTSIPMYFPTKNTMFILLPLCLVDDDQVDITLVTEKTKSGNYLGHTILPLEWAYSNARLVSRPESDWLQPEKITPSAASDLFDI